MPPKPPKEKAAQKERENGVNGETLMKQQKQDEEPQTFITVDQPHIRNKKG